MNLIPQRKCGRVSRIAYVVCVGVVMFLSTFFGCGKQEDKQIKNPEAKVKQYLDKKYEDEFDILTMEKVNIGQNFANYVYRGTAGSSGEPEFSFTMNADGIIKDNYPSIWYAEAMQQDVIMLFDSYGLALKDVTWKYLQKAEKYSDYETYKANQNLMFQCDIGEEIGGNEEKIKKLYELAIELKNEGYFFYIGSEAFGVKEYLIYTESADLISEEKWLQRTMTE